ncbi:mitochondrial ribosomal protein L54 [Nomia melanderi]|uniref:mitochondrial ribosomal protein L54 n=1 Tax=Nomia melanderi TaxID=2448451 RepID=UPI0013040211|nr:39S ribosomal protein L54, mitochondrial [Nomia melanderi]
MSFLSTLRLLQIRERFITPVHYAIQVKHYAVVAPKKQKKMVKIEKVELPVEKDVNKLLTYVCGTNIYKEGEDVTLKPDSEYPDWLWEIRTEPYELSELDPNTKVYWRYVRRAALRRKNRYAEYYGLH